MDKTRGAHGLGLGVEDRIVWREPEGGIRKSDVSVETTERASESEHPEVAKKIE
jgi:hypothetical protein